MHLELVDVKGTVLVRRCKPEQLELVGVERLFRRSAGLISAVCSGRPGQALYLNLNHKDNLDRLSINGQEACVTLLGLEFDGQLELRLQCIRCSVNLSGCRIGSLNLRSESELCSLDLCDYSPQLLKLDAELSGTTLGGVCLGGAGYNRITLRNRSNLCMYLSDEPAAERTIEFNRDANSQAKIHLPSAEYRLLGAEYEHWTVQGSSLFIELNRPCSEDSDSSETEPENCCCYCLRAEAVYRLEPCQHLCACERCFQKTRQHFPVGFACPLCRGSVHSARILL
jgi:hypothetical protein